MMKRTLAVVDLTTHVKLAEKASSQLVPHFMEQTWRVWKRYRVPIAFQIEVLHHVTQLVCELRAGHPVKAVMRIEEWEDVAGPTLYLERFMEQEPREVRIIVILPFA